MEFKVVFAEQSERDLKSIARYISRHAGTHIATRFGNQLIDHALTLATLPERGRIVPEFGQRDIREIIFRSYRIVYRIRPQLVEIIRFGMRRGERHRLTLTISEPLAVRSAAMAGAGL
jgi:addiction module RelE/StbE family toxin